MNNLFRHHDEALQNNENGLQDLNASGPRGTDPANATAPSNGAPTTKNVDLVEALAPHANAHTELVAAYEELAVQADGLLEGHDDHSNRIDNVNCRSDDIETQVDTCSPKKDIHVSQLTLP